MNYTQDKNGDLHLHLNKNEMPSNIAPTQEEKNKMLKDVQNTINSMFGNLIQTPKKQ